MERNPGEVPDFWMGDGDSAVGFELIDAALRQPVEWSSGPLDDVKMPHVCMLSHFSHVQLFCDPVDWSLPGSSVHEIF